MGILSIGVYRNHFTPGYIQEMDNTIEEYNPDFATSIDFLNPIGKQEFKVLKHLLLLLYVVSSSDVGFAAGKVPRAAKLAAISTLLWPR